MCLQVALTQDLACVGIDDAAGLALLAAAAAENENVATEAAAGFAFGAAGALTAFVAGGGDEWAGETVADGAGKGVVGDAYGQLGAVAAAQENGDVGGSGQQ